MREVLQQIEKWLQAGEQVAVATVVRVYKSAPRQPGAVMAVSGRGEVAGSVSGGCVESALFDEAMDCLQTGQPRLVRYGISDEDATAVGLTCGGTIEVFVERLDWAPLLLPALASALRTERPAALVTVTTGQGLGGKLLVGEDGPLGGLESPDLTRAVAREAASMLQQGATGLRHFGPDGEARRDDVTVFVEAFAPPPRLFVFGAIDFAAAAVRIGTFLGYRVTLCDARGVFATRARFPEADEVLVQWPHEYLAQQQTGPRDAILVLTHDSKFDIPVLLEALRTPAAYIGALGSRATHAKRHRELLEAGAQPADLERISSPVGLDIGGQTPEEAAVSIAAEIIALRHGRAGGRLSQTAGRIHG